MFSDPKMRNFFAQGAALIESGRREFYNSET